MQDHKDTRRENTRPNKAEALTKIMNIYICIYIYIYIYNIYIYYIYINIIYILYIIYIYIYIYISTIGGLNPLFFKGFSTKTKCSKK